MTDKQKWLSRRYVLYRVLTNLWFVGSIWLYLYRLFITDQQVGVLDGMAFAIGLVAEVPSGALADKFGRDKIVRLGQILAGSGLLIQAVGSGFGQFVIGQAIMMIGMSFVSGADEALFFEQLGFKRTSQNWRKLVMRGSQMGLIGSVLALIIGGWLHAINPRLPWIVNGLAFIAAALILLPMRDTRPKSAREGFTEEVRGYFRNIALGFRQFRLPKLWPYVPTILTVQGLFYTVGFGVLRLFLLDRFYFSAFLGSVAIASCSLITVGVLSLMHKHANKLSEKHVLTAISLSAVASLLLSVANIGLWGYVVILVLYVGEHVLYPFMSEILNNHAPEDQRATVLSVASFLKSLPYVGLAPLLGFLNTHGTLHYFLISWSILIAAAITLYLASAKHDTRINLREITE